MNKPEVIVLHHSATKDSGTVSWGAIRKFHMEQLKMRDIGYHAGIELVGDNYECMIGRRPHELGAHTVGLNARSLGFCFVGDYDQVEPPQQMLEIAVDRVLLPWLLELRLTPDDIWGHYAFAPKTCPGKKFDINRVKAIIKERLR